MRHTLRFIYGELLFAIRRITADSGKYLRGTLKFSLDGKRKYGKNSAQRSEDISQRFFQLIAEFV